MTGWTISDIPDQTGKRAVITGATGGIGFETALGLAHANAEVILTGRNAAKGSDALARIRKAHPAANIRFELLDVASLASVRAFAQRMQAEDRPIDMLINNAGVMMLPRREVTEDGFERQLGTNYLGHFALTALLLPLLRRAPAPRTVQVASIAHRDGRIVLDDLQGERRYQPWPAYRQSKLAMLMFALELERRGEAAGWGIASIAAHPGVARTDLFANGPLGGRTGLITRLFDLVSRLFMHSAAAGALPILYAATAPEAVGGGYYGPLGFREMRGPTGSAEVRPQARDDIVSARLWAASEALTGIRFPA
jgi:NAD(P)-dependent dehydrogenase (short-subunit alcohol dehydrogenase family)